MLLGLFGCYRHEGSDIVPYIGNVSKSVKGVSLQKIIQKVRLWYIQSRFVAHIAAEIIIAVRLFKIKVSKSYFLKLIGFFVLAVFAGKFSLLLPLIWQKQFLFMLLFLGVVSIAFEWKQVKYLIMRLKEDKKIF